MKKAKLTNDQLKKLGLGVMGFIALLYVYFTFLLSPLQSKREVMVRQMDDLQQKIGSSKSELTKATKLETEASTATQRYDALKALTPEGAPIAWFPPRMKSFFAKEQIEKTAAKIESQSAFTEKELAGWIRYNWVIDLPQSDYATVGKAIASLENAEPLLSIRKVSIKGLADAPQFQQVTLTASTVIVKR